MRVLAFEWAARLSIEGEPTHSIIERAEDFLKFLRAGL
jgi:hypothetical protein